MNNQQTLKYITINGKLDTSFTLGIKRQQAARTLKRLVRASAYATVKYLDRAYADMWDADERTTKHRDTWNATWNNVQTDVVVQKVSYLLDRERDTEGRFVPIAPRR